MSMAAARTVTPKFPLLLLETVQAMDRPAEVLKDEDVSLSMPRRFGLNPMVHTHIHRFRQAVGAKRLVSEEEVTQWIQVVIRRPDADEVFAKAGRRMARELWSGQSRLSRSRPRILPGFLGRYAASRVIRRHFRTLIGRANATWSRAPHTLRLQNALTARADPGGAACAFYGGVMEELLTLCTGRRHAVQHTQCAARESDVCEWVAEADK